MNRKGPIEVTNKKTHTHTHTEEWKGFPRVGGVFYVTTERSFKRFHPLVLEEKVKRRQSHRPTVTGDANTPPSSGRRVCDVSKEIKIGSFQTSTFIFYTSAKHAAV
ncbi:hypothetical protein JOB18_008309 [Solea senegalensis]|uniref:Uncharacterized protein n=1 Tax=Solea senegalensis TaxID=28829 RepID=A0AAV6RJG2_SOLSE|nr:hypothetical protein JOB18_008309 [Solea senegalensis]